MKDNYNNNKPYWGLELATYIDISNSIPLDSEKFLL